MARERLCQDHRRRHLPGGGCVEGVVLLLFPAQGRPAVRGRRALDGRRARQGARAHDASRTRCPRSSPPFSRHSKTTMRTSTPELLMEAILEGYRQAIAGHDHLERTSVIFARGIRPGRRRRQAPGRLRGRPRRDRRAVAGQRGCPTLGGRTLRGPVVRRSGRSRRRRPRRRLQRDSE